MAVTEQTVLASLQAMRVAFPGAAVVITIRGKPIKAIERQGVQDSEAGGMGVFPGSTGHFVLTEAPPADMRDGDLITITRDGRNVELRLVGIGRPYAGFVRVYYGDQFGKGRV
jgi:hypothetical protein